MSSKLTRTSAIIFFLISIIISAIGWKVSSIQTYPFSRFPFYFSEVSKDGWSGKNFKVDLKDSLPLGGSSMTFAFDFWRPGNVNKLSSLQASVCGQLYTFDKVSNSSVFSIELPSEDECAQRFVSFEATPPFLTHDKRELGVKVLKATIRPYLTQKDGISIVTKAILIFIVALIVYQAFGAFMVSVFFLIAFWISTHQFWDVKQEFTYFFILSGIMGLGALIRFRESLVTMNTRVVSLILLLIVLGGCILRIKGLSFGLPHFFHPDETRKGRIALRFLQSGNLDPEYFLHPTLLLYLTALVGKVRSVLFGFEPTVQDMVYSGRLVSCIAGICSIIFSFEVARRIFSKEAGLITAGIVAFSPLTIACSHYLKEDSLMLSLLLLGIVIALSGTKRKFCYPIAFFVAGMSMSAKYSGLLSALPVFFIALLFDREYLMKNKRLFFLFSSFVLVGFLCCSPYILINYTKFIQDFSSEGRHMIDGHHDVIISPLDHFLLFHMTRSVVPAFGGSLLSSVVIFSFFILIGNFFKSPTRSVFFVIMLSLLFYLPGELVNAKPPPQPERYILPSIPFIALGAAYILTKVRGGVVLALCLVGVIACKSMLFASSLVPDTREIMGEWIVKNIPAHTTIAIDALPYTPLLPDVYEVKNLGAFEERRALSPENLKEQGVEYLLVTSLSFDRYFYTRNSDQIVKERFKEIFSTLPLVHEVVPKYGTYGFHNPRLYLYKVAD